MAKVKIINNNNESQYNGNIIKKGQYFYVSIEVEKDNNLDHIINNIQGYLDGIGDVTLVDCSLDSITENIKNNYNIYKYVASYCITGYIDSNNLNLYYIRLYYKELDYFFVKDKPIINYKNGKFSITQKNASKILYNGKKVKISYFRCGGTKKDIYGNKIFENPANIEVVFKEKILLNTLDEEIRKIENTFGFIINQKMNIISLSVGDDNGEYHDLYPRFLKKYEDIVLEDLHIVDISSEKLLKDILKKYYEDVHIASAINIYYEYIYNDLNNIFEFTSLVNTLELILSSSKYKNDLISYTIKNNVELVENNKIMKSILEKSNEKEKKLLYKIYNYKNTELRDKFNYVFYEIFKLLQNDSSNKYFSKIIDTRNYYVHGTKTTRMLSPVDLLITTKLLKCIIYLLIKNACSDEINILIDKYYEMIPIIYNNIVDSM